MREGKDHHSHMRMGFDIKKHKPNPKDKKEHDIWSLILIHLDNQTKVLNKLMWTSLMCGEDLSWVITQWPGLKEIEKTLVVSL